MLRGKKRRKDLLAKLVVGSLILLCGYEPAMAGQVQASGHDAFVAQLKSSGLKIALHRQTGKVSFLGTSRTKPMASPGMVSGASVAANAMVHAEQYGKLFGLENPGQELKVWKTGANGAGGGVVRYQQLHGGLPVIGGELMVNLDGAGSLLSMNGEIGAVPKDFSAAPAIDGTRAAATAITAVAKWHDLTEGDLQASTPVLSIYDPQLLGSSSSHGLAVRLVWRLEVTPLALAPIREFVLIDAADGSIALHFNQVDTAKNRNTYTAGSTATLPGTQVCTEADGDACSSGANTQADFAHHYAGDTYDFYLNHHNRDSFDGEGGTLISTVLFDDGVTCPNAFWDGNQMVYCQGFPQADDVVAHELTHAVTEKTSGLFYYYQSGAINESLSDVWGEFVDQGNGSGTDTVAMKWKMGEDIDPVTGMGIIRDMADPTVYGDPDRMTSVNYVTSSTDNGGVHSNSGINNKAAYLMTAGGTFNGQTISGLGINKTAAVYYEVQTNLLTSGSDYLDLSNALNQACANLVGGAAGITVADCNEVGKVTTAVEMAQEPVAGFNPEAQVCAPGFVPEDAFFDNLENTSSGNWSITSTSATNWAYTTGYATSGIYSLYGIDPEVVSDHSVLFANPVNVPAGQPYLYFRHAYSFEGAGTSHYDGGVLEYSTDGGSVWNDAMSSLYDSGKNYLGTISASYGNPLAGRAAFTGLSNGYISTRLDLAPLAGQNVKFRWRVGSDSSVGEMGWLLDDVRIYTCETEASPVTVSKVGAYDQGNWYLDASGNGIWDPGSDFYGSFGTAAMTPLVGDWNGNGHTKIAAYVNGTWYFDLNGNGLWDGEPTDRMVTSFGDAADIPVAGDWNGDGLAEIGIYRPSNFTWYLDYDGNFAFDPAVDVAQPFGFAGCIPVVADWNGNGNSKIGVYFEGQWYLDASGNFAWDGSPADTYVASFGVAGMLPVAGDWSGSGVDRIGAYRDGNWYLDLDGNGSWNPASDSQKGPFGVAGMLPMVGKW